MQCQALLSRLALATVILAGPAAFAEAPRFVRLEYERQEGAATCPDDTAIRAARPSYRAMLHRHFLQNL